MKPDVFISYSTKDARACKRIVTDLRSEGLEVWHDSSHVSGGKRLREEIDQGIGNSGCFVLLLSEHSRRSRWVLNELDTAMLREIRERRTLVIPVLLGTLTDRQIPGDLRGKHHIDLRHAFGTQYRRKREILLAAVRLVLPSRTALRGRQMMGLSAIEFLYGKPYRANRVLGLDQAAWTGFTDAFLTPTDWPDEFLPALREFLDRYGVEAVKRLLMFIIDVRRITFPASEATMVDALREAQMFVMMMSVHDYSVERGYRGIQFGLHNGELLFRIVLADKGPGKHRSRRSL